jgi:hypothetical protein
MASKGVLMKAFFDQFLAFAKELTEMYPNDPDFSLFLTTLQMAKTANPKMVIETLNANIAGFEDKIMAKDESFFMNYNFEKQYASEVEDVNVFAKLRDYNKTMSPESKENVWKYVQNIMRLGKACS